MTHFTRIALLSIPLVIAACKKDKDGGADKAGKPTEAKTEPAKPEPPLDLTDTVDLGAAETDPDSKRFTGMKVKAPAGAKGESGMTGVVVRIGERQAYEISKAYEPGFVATTKQKANEDKLDKVVKFHIDSPEAILWETKSELGGDNNFHFAAEVKLSEDFTAKCYNSGWGNFTKAQAEALLESCQSVAK